MDTAEVCASWELKARLKPGCHFSEDEERRIENRLKAISDDNAAQRAEQAKNFVELVALLTNAQREKEIKNGHSG
jgi:hypothetical protein